MQPPDEKTVDFSTSKNPLVLIGASVRAAAQSAKRAKYDVFGIDRFGDSDTRKACRWFLSLAELEEMQPPEIGQLLAGSKRPVPVMVVGDFHQAGTQLGPQPGIQPATSCDESADGFNAVLQVIYEHTQPIGATPPTLQALDDPAVLARIAIRARTHFPAYRLGDSAPKSSTAKLPGAASSTLGSDIPGRWLTKSMHSSGGLGVRWSHGVDASGGPLSDSSGEIRQRWQNGRSYGVSFLSDGEQVVLLGCCRSLFTAIDELRYVYAGSYGPVRLPEIVSGQLHAIGRQVVLQTGITGLFNADVLVDREDSVTLLEINPRWSASMECVERSLVATSQASISPPESFIAWAINASQEHSLSVKQRRIDSMLYDGPRFLKHVVYARRSGRFDHSVLETIDTGKDSGFDSVAFCDVPADGTPMQTNQPLMSLVCRTEFRSRLDWRKTRRLLASLQKAVV